MKHFPQIHSAMLEFEFHTFLQHTSPLSTHCSHRPFPQQPPPTAVQLHPTVVPCMRPAEHKALVNRSLTLYHKITCFNPFPNDKF